MNEKKESTMRPTRVLVPMAVAASLFLAACGPSGSRAPITGGATNSQSPSSTPTTSPSEAPVSVEPPVPVESSPPGDIPDDTQFVAYHSNKDGWTVTVPEGWSRTRTGTTVTFTDKLNTVQVDARPGDPVSVAAVKKTDVPALKKSTRAFKLVSVTRVTLPAGQAVLISYQDNSDPNPVTGKQYRLDVLRYVVFHAGTRTTLTLLSPVGADNVDPWRIVTQSLKAA
jgi:hypothetical protein